MKRTNVILHNFVINQERWETTKERRCVFEAIPDLKDITSNPIVKLVLMASRDA